MEITIKRLHLRIIISQTEPLLFISYDSLERLPFLERVLLYNTSKIEPITPAEIAFVIAATIPCVNTRFTGSAYTTISSIGATTTHEIALAAIWKTLNMIISFFPNSPSSTRSLGKRMSDE